MLKLDQVSIVIDQILSAEVKLELMPKKDLRDFIKYCDLRIDSGTNYHLSPHPHWEAFRTLAHNLLEEE